jgi:phage terminase large subunit
MILTKKQTEALDIWEDNHTKELVFGGGAGGAKSVLGCYCILKTALKYDKTRWVMGRAKLKTLKETTLNSFYWVAGEQGLRAKKHYNLNSQSNCITLFNGSEIYLKDLFYYPSDPQFDELGSLEITGAFVDEVNQITEKAKNVLNSRIRYGLDNNNLIPKSIGTCNPSKGWVYKDFYKAKKDGTIKDYRNFIQALVTDNPFISKHYIDNLNNLDEVSKQRLLYGNWEYDDDPATLISYEKIVDLFVNEHVKDGLKYITCDVARLGKDKTVIIVWSGLRAIHITILDKSRTDETAAAIRRIQTTYSVPNSNTIIDEDGVGGGVVDQLRCKGFVNNSRPIQIVGKDCNYQNLRSQCYFKLADVVNANEMYIDSKDINIRQMITQELEQVKQAHIDKDTKLAMISKDIIKTMIGRSPDIMDALMMRMFFELQPALFTGHRLAK